MDLIYISDSYQFVELEMYILQIYLLYVIYPENIFLDHYFTLFMSTINIIYVMELLLFI